MRAKGHRRITENTAGGWHRSVSPGVRISLNSGKLRRSCYPTGFRTPPPDDSQKVTKVIRCRRGSPTSEARLPRAQRQFAPTPPPQTATGPAASRATRPTIPLRVASLLPARGRLLLSCLRVSRSAPRCAPLAQPHMRSRNLRRLGSPPRRMVRLSGLTIYILGFLGEWATRYSMGDRSPNPRHFVGLAPAGTTSACAHERQARSLIARVTC